MTSPDRRPGPRTDVDVQSVLLDVALRMFGAASIDAVSLRAVAREAGVAPAALTHYYPTKSDLIEAVVQRVAEPVGRQVRDRLMTLAKQEPAPQVRDLVEAVTLPFVDLVNQDPVSGLHWMKLVTALAVAEDPIWLRGIARSPSIADLFEAVAARAMPDLKDRALMLRAGISMYSMLSAISGADLAGYGRPASSRGLDPEYVEQLIIFTSAGLAADPG